MKTLGAIASVAILGLMLISVMSTMLFTINTVHAAPLPPALAAADLNQDGNVTLVDFTGFATIYGWNSTNPGWNLPIHLGWLNASAADFNANGKIDLSDLVTMAYAFKLNMT